MSLRKYKFAIIILSSLVVAGGGIISYQFYQEAEAEAAVEVQKQEEEILQKDVVNAETKVISAEMNPIQENIDAAKEVVDLLPKSEGRQALFERLAFVKEEFNRVEKAKEDARLAELREEIHQAKIDLGIDGTPSEEDLVEILHKMTHQKVRSEEKWGFVQMTEVNLIAVKEVLQEKPSFNQKIDILAIVTNWLNNDFSNIVADHNLIWAGKEGTVGKAYGSLSQKEEEALVKEQFGVQE